MGIFEHSPVVHTTRPARATPIDTGLVEDRGQATVTLHHLTREREPSRVSLDPLVDDHRASHRHLIG